MLESLKVIGLDISKVKFGRDVVVHQMTNLYGCEIGDETKIGAFVEIQKGAKIGPRCKISSHTFICEGVTIAEGVFIGHNVTFINDKNPRATDQHGDLLKAGDWKCIPTEVCAGASIGSGATIMCGVRIGVNAVVGAGAVVTKDVEDGQTVIGLPAAPRTPGCFSHPRISLT